MAKPKYTKTTVQEIRPPWHYLLIGAGWASAFWLAIILGSLLAAALNW